MRRREAIATLCAFAVAGPRRALAQARRWRVGLVTPLSAADAQPRLEYFQQRLRELGYDDAAIQVEVRATDGKFDPIPAIVAELLAAKVDLLVTIGTPATLAAKRATTTVPIVMSAVADPIGAGLISSYNRPGGNITGMSLLVYGLEIGGKRLQLLREIAPRVERIAIPWDPRNRGDETHFREIQKAARAINLKLIPVELTDPAAATHALEKSLAQRPDSLLVTEGGNNVIARKEIVAFAQRHRLPAIYGVRPFVDAGGLICYGPSPADQMRGAAYYVDQIFKGAKPADLPVQQPSRFELVINLKAAKAIGLTIPQAMLLRADLVVE